MEALLMVLLLIFAGAGAGLTVMLSGSNNRRVVAAWLIASAQAMDERRSAFAAIDLERRERQRELEQQLCRTKNAAARI